MAPVRKTGDRRRHHRKDGRQSLLVYLTPDLIRAVKTAAVQDGRHVYEIAEEALSAWLSSAKQTDTGA